MGSILVLIVMLCACVSLSSACACVPIESPKHYCHYDLIFRGTVQTEHKERETPLDPEDPFSEFDFDSNWVYTVRVEQPVKMPENLQGKDTITIKTKTQGRFCGTRFNVDDDELIFASINSEGNVVTGACEPNTPWANMTDSFRELITEDLMDICSNPEPFLYQAGNA